MDSFMVAVVIAIVACGVFGGGYALGFRHGVNTAAKVWRKQ